MRSRKPMKLALWYKKTETVSRAALCTACAKNLLHFYFNIDTAWQIQTHKRVDGFWGWRKNIDKPFMRTHFVLFLAGFMHKCGSVHTEFFNFCRQWHRPHDCGSVSFGGFDNRFCCDIDNFTVVCPNFNPNTRSDILLFFLFGHHMIKRAIWHGKEEGVPSSFFTSCLSW